MPTRLTAEIFALPLSLEAWSKSLPQATTVACNGLVRWLVHGGSLPHQGKQYCLGPNLSQQSIAKI